MSDTTIVITILTALGAVLFAAASHLSDVLVRARALRLPARIAGRMEEEWLGELNAIASRPGKLAFAIALTLTRRHAFATPGEDPMSEIHDRPAGRFGVLGGRKSLMVLSTLLFAIAAFWASFLLPKRYASESLIVVRPREIPSSLFVDLTAGSAEEQLKSIEQTVMSRTALVAIAREFSSEIAQKGQTIDRTIEELRKDITVRVTPSIEGTLSTASLRLGYVGPDPRLAQKVTSKLTLFFIESNNRTREAQVSGTRDFLQRRLESIAERLGQKGDQLARVRAAEGPEAARLLAIEYDLLVSTYKTVFAKYEDAQMTEALESEQKGQAFVVVDAANLPTTPVLPDRLAITGVGALAGFALGGMALVGLGRRQRRAIA